MIALTKGGAFLLDGETIASGGDCEKQAAALAGKPVSKEDAKKGTISYEILSAHNAADDETRLKLRFDSLASHDLTYVGVIQTAKASGLEEFPVPYALTNCHNSLCAVGGTLNEDDHQFGLSSAKKYGGIYVPPHLAVIHSYMRETSAECGAMILGTDSHTRYGAMGTMGIGEGGGEVVKQLLKKTYDIDYPEIVLVMLKGKPAPGVGPQDVALAIIGAVFDSGYVKNKVMEFAGEGVEHLSADFRHGIDVMTTETACLSSIWQTDDVIKEYYRVHGRPDAFKKLRPKQLAWYDGVVTVDLSAIKPMIALPFHPSNVFTIEDANKNAGDILRTVEKAAEELIESKNAKCVLTDKISGGKIKADQGIIAGCAGGTFENIASAARIIGAGRLGNDVFSLSVYPASQPVMIDLLKKNIWTHLTQSGAVMRSSFCGPCFGAGDVPANGQLSVRHVTRNFPNREGSKPGEGQVASVALMDARSIAATAVHGGILTPATDIPTGALALNERFEFDDSAYKARVYYGFGKAIPETEIICGPNITDWPAMGALTENLLLGIASVIHDPVTTTDELIPSGDTSTYRSNPAGMAEFTLSRKDPQYVARAKKFAALEKARNEGGLSDEICATLKKLGAGAEDTGIGSVVYAVKPGDGSAREQAASCQRVLGGWANIAREYATKRYRSNLINWGMLPLLMDGEADFECGDFIFLKGIKTAVEKGEREVQAWYAGKEIKPLQLALGAMTGEERKIVLAGCLINYYKEKSA